MQVEYGSFDNGYSISWFYRIGEFYFYDTKMDDYHSAHYEAEMHNCFFDEFNLVGFAYIDRNSQELCFVTFYDAYDYKILDKRTGDVMESKKFKELDESGAISDDEYQFYEDSYRVNGEYVPMSVLYPETRGMERSDEIERLIRNKREREAKKNRHV